MLTAEECIRQIKEARKLFGTYTWDDKGPREVMDMPAIMNEFNSMSATEVRDILIKVMKYKHGYLFCSEVLASSQARSDEDFGILEEAMPDGW